MRSSTTRTRGVEPRIWNSAKRPKPENVRPGNDGSPWSCQKLTARRNCGSVAGWPSEDTMNASRFLGLPHGSTPRSGDPSGSDRRFKASCEPVGSEITQDPRESTGGVDVLAECDSPDALRRRHREPPHLPRRAEEIATDEEELLLARACSLQLLEGEVVAHDHDWSRGALDDPAERGQQIRLGGIGEIDRVDAAIDVVRSTPALPGRPRTPPERRRSPTPGDSSSCPRRPRPSPRGTAGRTCTASSEAENCCRSGRA